MQLPIDARDAPFKPKYIEDETPMLSRWTVFGRDASGRVFLIGGNNGNEDIFAGLLPEQADAMVEARNAFCDRVLEILNG